MTPKEAAKLRILDPACGSGSFLIGAYQYLLDWHLAWYMKNDPEKLMQGQKPRALPDRRRVNTGSPPRNGNGSSQ